MDYAIISAEIVCSCMMLIIGYALFTEKRKELSHIFFTWCIVGVLLALVNDSLSYILEAIHSNEVHIFITNLLAILAGDFLMFFYGLYVWSIVNEKKKKNIFGKTFVIITMLISVSDFIFEVYGAFSSKTFSIVNGAFIPEKLYFVYFTVQLLLLAICMIYLIINIETIGLKTLAVFGVYYFFPVISMIMIIANPEYSFICTSIAISFLVIYIGIEKEKETRGAIMAQLLNTDIMTNLSNRNAYEEMIQECQNNDSNDMVGVIFCDLNHLKKINDEQGHVAGDQYIIKFADILKDCFPENEIYRISGDEFVITFKNADESNLKNDLEKITTITQTEKHIASCGMGSGLIKNIIDVVKIAEHNMYDNKKAYYSAFGISRD